MDLEVETLESYPDDAPLELKICQYYPSHVLNADSLYTILQFLRNTSLYSYSGSHNCHYAKLLNLLRCTENFVTHAYHWQLWATIDNSLAFAYDLPIDSSKIALSMVAYPIILTKEEKYG